MPEEWPYGARGPAHEPAGSPISEDRLAMLEEVAGGAAIAGELMRLFVQDVPLLLSRIRDAACAEDADALERSAHALKGSASTVGAGGMIEQCRQIQALARTRDWPRSGAAVSTLEAEFERVRRALGEWLAGR